MAVSRSAIATMTMFLSSICAASFMSTSEVLCDTGDDPEFDDDIKIEFYWGAPPEGEDNVAHYNLYVYVYDRYLDPSSLRKTGPLEYEGPSKAPTRRNPYPLPEDMGIEDGKGYQLQVAAVGTNGVTGEKSELSEIVWCKLRSPGDVNAEIPGDADGNQRTVYYDIYGRPCVDDGDGEILGRAFGKRRGDTLFDYRADFNYDDCVDVLDMIIYMRHGGALTGIVNQQD